MRLWAFSLFRVLPEFRRLEAEGQEHLKEEFALLLSRWQAREGFLAVHSLVGFSAEADFLLWQGVEDPRALQAFRRELHRTRLMGYLEPVALYLDRGEGEPGEGFLALLPYGLEGALPGGVRAFRGENLLALEGPWEVLFPLTLREGGHLAVRRTPRELLDEL
ncbi:chlorite dismutase family protein [Thermus amyloliquefaciens]|uniref:chlorite dismutase family protein n=1 Tax=Thermus amyloliquefaciens TaxID=1449080 RepID=UPI000570F84B|nr:chlorite dismutase family protein [Thermus amyloliquefaciens]